MTLLDETYQLLHPIGRGRTGTVYEATHAQQGGRLAIKVLDSERAQDASRVERFRREADAARRLSHPNIVSVQGFGATERGELYLVMELLDGVPLDQELERSPLLPLPRAIDIITQVARALEHAHGMDVIHRDLKPSNIMLLRQPSGGELVKLVDFSVAKIMADDEQLYSGSPLTLEFEVVGTLAYMSPEQAFHDPVDNRADLYSWGCVAFELLSGTKFFSGEAWQLLDALANNNPLPPSAKAPAERQIPAALDRLVHGCLAQKPEQRPRDARQLLDVLEPLLA